MKKEYKILTIIFITSIFLSLSINITSAFLISDFFKNIFQGKITGEIISPDDFDNSFDINRWSQMNLNNPASVHGGRLKAVGSAEDVANSISGVSSSGKWKLQGDFDIQVNYDASIQPNTKGVSNSAATASLVVSGKSHSYYLMNMKGSDGTYSIVSWSDQSGWYKWQAGSNLGKFRIKRTGNIIKGYIQSSSESRVSRSIVNLEVNENWREYISITNGDTSDMTITLKVYNNINGNANGIVPQAYFDNFIINSGSIIDLACIPNCIGKTCGEDGCGGSCGACASGKVCSNGDCMISTSLPKLVSSSAPPSANLGGTFELKCDFGVPWLNCVIARHGNNNCVYKRYEGTESIWECTASNAGIIDNYCNLFDYAPNSKCVAQENMITKTNVISPSKLKLASASASASVSLGGSFEIKCDFGERLPCIVATSGGKGCKFSRFDGTAAIFKCVGLKQGLQDNYCNLFDYAPNSKCVAQTDWIQTTNVIVSSPSSSSVIPIRPGKLCNSNADCYTKNKCYVSVCEENCGYCEIIGKCKYTPITCRKGYYCSPKQGCVSECADNNACTIEIYDQTKGECIWFERSCNDNNPCTDDSCNTITGCKNIRKRCDDHNPCTADYCYSPDNKQTECKHSTFNVDGTKCITSKQTEGICNEGACIPIKCTSDKDCGIIDPDKKVCDIDTGECINPCLDKSARTKCGKLDDGFDCGICDPGFKCTFDGNENICVYPCSLDYSYKFSKLINRNCGTVTDDLGKEYNCGTCGIWQSCKDTGDGLDIKSYRCVDKCRNDDGTKMECGIDENYKCGTCPEGKTCNENHVCRDTCKNFDGTDMECGWDTNYLDEIVECGVCPEGLACSEVIEDDHFCYDPCENSYDGSKRNCGTVTDDLGNEYNCGTCSKLEMCNEAKGVCEIKCPKCFLGLFCTNNCPPGQSCQEGTCSSCNVPEEYKCAECSKEVCDSLLYNQCNQESDSENLDEEEDFSDCLAYCMEIEEYCSKDVTTQNSDDEENEKEKNKNANENCGDCEAKPGEKLWKDVNFGIGIINLNSLISGNPNIDIKTLAGAYFNSRMGIKGYGAMAVIYYNGCKKIDEEKLRNIRGFINVNKGKIPIAIMDIGGESCKKNKEFLEVLNKRRCFGSGVLVARERIRKELEKGDIKTDSSLGDDVGIVIYTDKMGMIVLLNIDDIKQIMGVPVSKKIIALGLIINYLWEDINNPEGILVTNKKSCKAVLDRIQAAESDESNKQK